VAESAVKRDWGEQNVGFNGVCALLRLDYVIRKVGIFIYYIINFINKNS
jgi:hypothetical protein